MPKILDSERQSLVSITFRERGGKTELTSCQTGLGSIADRDEHIEGWNSALNELVGYLGERTS